MNIARLRSSILHFVLATAATLLFAASGYAQADLFFSGGLGSALRLKITAPVTYSVLFTEMGVPIFQFTLPGSFTRTFAETNVSLSGTVTYSIDGGAPHTINVLNSPFSINATAPPPTFGFNFAGYFNFGDSLTSGSTITLTAGTLTTNGPISEAPPADGSAFTSLYDFNGNLVSGPGLTVPEPSVLALIILGGVVLLATHRPTRMEGVKRGMGKARGT